VLLGCDPNYSRGRCAVPPCGSTPLVGRFGSVDDVVRVVPLLRDFLDRLTDLTAAIQSLLRSAALVFACRAAISDRRFVYAVDAPGTGSA